MKKLTKKQYFGCKKILKLLCNDLAKNLLYHYATSDHINFNCKIIIDKGLNEINFDEYIKVAYQLNNFIPRHCKLII